MKMKKGWQKRLALRIAEMFLLMTLGFMTSQIVKNVVKSNDKTAAEGCAVDAQLPSGGELDEFPEFSTNRRVEVFVDPETGVEYLIYHEKVGYSGSGGITPRLNPDGSVRVHEKE